MASRAQGRGHLRDLGAQPPALAFRGRALPLRLIRAILLDLPLGGDLGGLGHGCRGLPAGRVQASLQSRGLLAETPYLKLGSRGFPLRLVRRRGEREGLRLQVCVTLRRVSGVALALRLDAADPCL